MPIIHNKTDENFTVVSNLVLRDKKLSWKAKGIYAYLAGCKDGFNVSQTTLATFGNCGREAVSSGLKELTEKGLVQIEQTQVDGRFSENSWTILLPTVAAFPDSGSDDDDKPNTNKTKDNKTTLNNDAAPASPTPLTPSMKEKIDDLSDNPAVKAYLDKKFEREKKRAVAKMQQKFSPQFEQFYAVWPKRADKMLVAAAWEAAIETGVSDQTLLNKAKEEAKNGRYSQNPIKWLQTRSWECHSTPPGGAAIGDFRGGSLPPYQRRANQADVEHQKRLFNRQKDTDVFNQTMNMINNFEKSSNNVGNGVDNERAV